MSAQAFIAFLRCEATQAEERGKALRATAAAIEANASGEGKKKRKRDPNRPKRQHTAYTMFVQENYELIKRSNTPNIPSKDIISIVARQWGETGAEEKLMWKERANVHKTSQDAIVAVQGMIGQMTGQEQDLHGLLNADSQSHLEDVNDTTNVGVDTSKKRRAVRTQKVTKASAV